VPVPLSQDRLRILRFANDGNVITPWGATLSGRATASFGIDGLGARSAADASPSLPLSRQGADAAFQKLDVNLSYSQPLLTHLALNVAARAQTAFGQALLSSEQIGIANTTGLSAFDAGSVVGDEGFVVRAELSSPWSVPLPNAALNLAAAPYLFGGLGEVSLNDPTAGGGLDPRHVLGRRTAPRRRRTGHAFEWFAQLGIRPRHQQRRHRRRSRHPGVGVQVLARLVHDPRAHGPRLIPETLLVQ
jgi:hemolysin activation/secretion protein